MRPKLCLGCSLAGAGLCLLLLAEIPQSFSSVSLVAKRYWLSLPLVSGIMLLRTASLYMLMLTLGSRRPDRSVLSLAIFIFMMKFGLSCQSLELISHLAQPVCLNKHRGGCSFPLPNQLQIFSTHPFIHILDEASTLTFSAAKLVQATFLQVPGALFSEFFKTFPSAAHPKNFSCPRVK